MRRQSDGIQHSTHKPPKTIPRFCHAPLCRQGKAVLLRRNQEQRAVPDMAARKAGEMVIVRQQAAWRLASQAVPAGRKRPVHLLARAVSPLRGCLFVCREPMAAVAALATTQNLAVTHGPRVDDEEVMAAAPRAFDAAGRPVVYPESSCLQPSLPLHTSLASTAVYSRRLMVPSALMRS